MTGEKDGFDNNEDYIIKIWDAIKAKEYDVEVTFRDGDPDYFTPDAESYIDMFELSTVIQEIDLSASWNMISGYVVPNDLSVESVFSGIENNLLIAKNNDGEIYFPSLDINTIGTWNIQDGYKVYMESEDELILEGIQVDPENAPIQLSDRWNIISYLRDTEYSIADIMDQLSDNLLIVKNSDGEIYFPSLDINTIGTMYPGEGYKLYMNSEDVLTYPSNSLPKISLIDKNITPKAQKFIPEYRSTGNSSTLILSIDEAYNNFEICCFDTQENIIGSGKIQNGIVALSIWGDNELTDIKDGAFAGEKLSIRLFNENHNRWQDLKLFDLFEITNDISVDDLEYSENKVFISKIMNSEYSSEKSIMNITPNPAVNMLNIEFILIEKSNISLQVFNERGLLIDQRMLSYNENASVQIDVSNYPSGKYNVISYINGEKYTDSFLIIR